MNEETLKLVATYTKDFIDAALPIAKQAYNIGLVTLRIDAAGTLILGILGFFAAIFILLKVKKDISEAMRKANEKIKEKESGTYAYYEETCFTNYLMMDGVPHGVLALFSMIALIPSFFAISNIWLWVKLISPELWLAHMAIEKIVK